jgi:hypothetical protein
MTAMPISGSIIQNSARWRLVFEFSARKGRTERVDLVQCEAMASMLSFPDTVRNASAAEEILGGIHLALRVRPRIRPLAIATRSGQI